VRFIALPLVRSSAGRKSAVGFVRSLRILSRATKEVGIDIVHSHKRYTDVLGRILARISGAKHISTCHNTFENLRVFSPFGDQTIACSDKLLDMLVRDFGLGPQRVTRIYSGLKPLRLYTPGELSAARRQLGLVESTRVIASVAQLTPAKDHVTLINAIRLLHQKQVLQDVVFFLLGEGPERKKLQELVVHYSLQDDVIFLDGSTDAECVENVAEFFVLSSAREGLPYVLLEAASLAKPHVATSVGGIPEFVVHHETGLLVPPGNPARLADEILFLLEHPGEVNRLGMSAKQKYEAQHSFAGFMENMITFYRKVSGE
jgi:glycosyltransferase involved in cell wall biosynthesis